MNNQPITVYPVTQITTGSVSAEQAIIITLDYLSHNMQSIEQSHPGRTYALTLPQARFLVEKIGQHIARLEKSGQSAPPDQKH